MWQEEKHTPAAQRYIIKRWSIKWYNDVDDDADDDNDGGDGGGGGGGGEEEVYEIGVLHTINYLKDEKK